MSLQFGQEISQPEYYNTTITKNNSRVCNINLKRFQEPDNAWGIFGIFPILSFCPWAATAIFYVTQKKKKKLNE